MPLGYSGAPRITQSNQASRTRRLSRSLVTGNNGTPIRLTLYSTEEYLINASPVVANTQAERTVVPIFSTEFATYPGVELGYYKHAGFIRLQYMNTGADLFVVNADGTSFGGPITFTNTVTANGAVQINSTLNTTGAVVFGNTITSNGSVHFPIGTVSGNTTLNSTHFTVLVDGALGSYTITLPSAASAANRIYVIKKIDATANTVTIDGDGAETIDGASNTVLTAQWESVTIQSNGTSWFKIN